MKISTQITVIVVLAGLIIGGLYTFVYSITLDIEKELHDLAEIDDLKDKVSQLSLASENYITTREQRSLDAWYTLLDDITTHIREIDDFEEPQIVLQSVTSIEGAFELLNEIYSTPLLYPNKKQRSELEQRALMRLRSDIRQLMAVAYSVSHQKNESIRQLQNNQRFNFLAVLVPAFLLMLSMAYYLRRSIVKALWKLQRGAKAFSAGQLDHRILFKSDNEFQEVALQFNKMAGEIEGRIENERKLLAELEEKAGELEENNKALKNFAYVASHDLKEPLRMIQSFLTLLEKKYKQQLDDKAREYIFYATDGAKRMQALIDDLLEYSRVGRHKNRKEAIDFNSILEEVKQNLNVLINEHEAEVIKSGKLPVITAHKQEIVRVIQNMISNAIKFRKKDAPPEITISCIEKPQLWQFNISDNGIGISEEYRQQIFEIFNRLHSSKEYPGTGIGLAITKKIVENHGGNIWVESIPGKGSTFYFTIPKSSANEEHH